MEVAIKAGIKYFVGTVSLTLDELRAGGVDLSAVEKVSYEEFQFFKIVWIVYVKYF